jgi:hypothetical protein
MARKYRSPWWVSQRWSVETIAEVSPEHGRYKKGDWIEIYNGATKKAANELAASWTAKTGQPTRVVPGAGHKTRRDF